MRNRQTTQSPHAILDPTLRRVQPPNGSARRIILLCCCVLVAFFGILGLTGCFATTQPEGSTAYAHVSGDEAKRLIERGDSVLVDVRTEVDFDLGHIPGAVLIPFDQVTSAEAQKLLPKKDQLIIVYCDYGGISKTAAADLAAAGYTNVVEFDGLSVWNGELETGAE